MNAPKPLSAPPLSTILVVHRRENRSKCSVEPLRNQPGYIFWRYPRRVEEPTEGYIRLGLGGPLLTVADRMSGLLVLDGTWRLAEKMAKKYQSVEIRSLLPWQTAYPRVSEYFDDPASGLATIEALFAAYAQLGRDTSGLLDSYHWKQAFLEKNALLIEQCGNQGISSANF